MHVEFRIFKYNTSIPLLLNIVEWKIVAKLMILML